MDTLRTLFCIIGIFFRSKWMLFKARKKTEKEKRQMAYEFLHKAAPELMNSTGSRIIYHGLENLPEHSGVLYVGNHQSILDIPVLLTVMEYPTAFVNKKELDNVIFVGKLLKATGSVSIDRGDLRQSLEAIKLAAARLKEGLNIVIFPEGTRSKDGEIHEFKKGSLKAAFMAKAVIVPFRLQDNGKILEGNKGIHIEPTEVHVYFGEPIETEGLTKAEERAMQENIEEIVRTLK